MRAIGEDLQINDVVNAIGLVLPPNVGTEAIAKNVEQQQLGLRPPYTIANSSSWPILQTQEGASDREIGHA